MSFQNLTALFKFCKQKRIKIIGMETGNINIYADSQGMRKDIDLFAKNSIEINAMNGNYTRISTLARDSCGVPYLFDMVDYQTVFKNSQKIFYALIDCGFNVNTIDLNKNESIFYKLIGSFDVKAIRYIINLLVCNKEYHVYNMIDHHYILPSMITNEKNINVGKYYANWIRITKVKSEYINQE